MLEPEGDLYGSQARQVDDLNQRAREISRRDPELAQQLFEQARLLAQTGAYADRPNLAGLVTSLTGLARVHMENSPDLAARYCLQALALLDGQPAMPQLAEAQNVMGWIYFHLGDYSTAMEWVLKGLQQSKDQALLAHQAGSLDLIASIHSVTAEHTLALRAHQEALQIARSVQRKSQEANLMNNMAMSLVEMGDYSGALEIGQQSLGMFQELDSPLDIANTLDTLAQAYLGLNDYQRAEENLLSGLAVTEPTGNQILNCYLLKNLGRVYLAQEDVLRARTQAEHALAIAQHSGLRGEQAGCHRLLAEIFEKQSDFASAYRHFKQFHEINEEIAGDKATQRMAILNVIHAVENARHEAEIYRLRNIELQSEIDERKRIQVALEELATRDPLTSLFNRRYFLEKSEQEYLRAIRYRHPLAVIMIDLDHFKRINDTYGHPAGDQALTMVGQRLKAFTRSIDFAGRMGGEEFALVLPETEPEGAIQAAERLCRSFSDEVLLINSNAIRLTISIGLACFLPRQSDDPPTFDTLLQRADQALYNAKNEGRNQIKMYGST